MWLNHALLTLIVLAYLGIAALYAIRTPAWQVPDEPAHYNYVAQVAAQGCCPIIQMGDWDNAYLDSIKAAKFAPESLKGRLNTVEYEDHQPPLYYLIMAPIYSLSDGNLIAMRLFSALIGAGAIILGYAVVRVVFPAQPWLALTTAAFVAFLPQRIAMMAGVENDGLAELIVGLVLLACAVYLGFPQPLTPAFRKQRGGTVSVVLSVLIGAAFLTKLTIYPITVGIVGMTVLLCARREGWTLGRFIQQSLWIGIPALLIGAIWWTRNISVYGSIADIMAQKTHNAVVVGQPTFSGYVSQFGAEKWLRDGLQTTWQSFWGQFGWMGVPMTNAIYNGLFAFTTFVVVGAALALFRFWRALSPRQIEALIIFGVAALLAVLTFVGYNFSFVQFQGRYLYTGLIPMALFVAIGLTGWASLIARRFPLAYWVTVGAVCLFALLDVYVLFRIIIPALG
jgi:4-amino-4-deoxy-L-arabinose transferase-like glycosyltransferase